MGNGLLKSLLLFLFVSQGVYAAQTVYVHDQLHLGVRAEPNSSESPIVVVKTGEVLKVLDDQGNYLKIRTSKGVEGWVSKTYITAEKPARLRLAGLQEQHAALKTELDGLRQILAENGEKLEVTEKQRSELMSENASLHEKLSQYYDSNDEMKRKYGWIITAALLISMFVLGLYLGIRWHRDRVARKFGGLEV